MPYSINLSMTLQTEILSTVTSGFLKQTILLKSFNSVLFLVPEACNSKQLKSHSLFKVNGYTSMEPCNLPFSFGQSPGGISKSFTLKFFYVMGKALSGELSCPCDRSCCLSYS